MKETTSNEELEALFQETEEILSSQAQQDLILDLTLSRLEEQPEDSPQPQ